MSALLAGLAGAMIVGGILLGIYGLIPRPVPPPRPKRPARPGRLVHWWRALPGWQRWATLAALLVGLLVMVATGWVVAVPVLPAAVLGLPALLMVTSADRQIARMDAIAEWTRNLAGVLTAGQGIEAAIQASLRSAPDAIRPEVARLVGRMRSRWSTEQALRAYADDLDDATGDLVCAALILGAAKRGDGLARVLHDLAESVSADVRGRRLIEADRAKPRASARMVTLLSIGALVFFGLGGRFFAPYSTPLGQLILLVLLTCYGLLLWWLRRMAEVQPAARFLGKVNREVRRP
ncbi:MAG: type II secretion system F family protein [Propionibacteriaceae bacterium]|nr:type II secretion system F family protein [Propionibacteriaceae bacterium]